MKTDKPSPRPSAGSLAPVVFLAALLLAPAAGATGLRLNGDFLFARDTSYDVFSGKDQRGGLDLSFSYTFYYAGCAVLFDVEAGYMYFPPVEGTLFDAYPTTLLTHGLYGGLRVHLRIDRRYIEWLQPYVRVNGGAVWGKAELGAAGGQPSMEDWGSTGTVYAGGGVQVTIPTSVFKAKRKRLCLTKQFSFGMSWEAGYFWTGPMRFRLHPKGGTGGDVDPIDVEGVSLGALRLAGPMLRVSLVVTF
jgi:hypothetical protein